LLSPFGRNHSELFNRDKLIDGEEMMEEEQKSSEKQTDKVVWSEIYRSLEAIETEGALTKTLTLEEKQKILRARAKALAVEPVDRGAPVESIYVVEFLLAYEHYGIELSYIREIYPLKDLTPIPCTPSFVLGIINVRGQILSVIDIKKFFDLPEKGLTDLNKVIIVNFDRMEFGILADAVIGARAFPIAEIQPSLPTLTGIRAEYLMGVTTEQLVILDVKKIVSDPRIIVNEQVRI
jgi:purine-binding chemotaxis protein CheW